MMLKLIHRQHGSIPGIRLIRYVCRWFTAFTAKVIVTSDNSAYIRVRMVGASLRHVEDARCWLQAHLPLTADFSIRNW